MRTQPIRYHIHLFTFRTPHSPLRILSAVFYLLLFTIPTTIFAVSPLLNVPLDDPMLEDTYTFIEHVTLKYDLERGIQNQRPYSYGHVRTILEQLSTHEAELTRVEKHLLTQLNHLFSDNPPSLVHAEGKTGRAKRGKTGSGQDGKMTGNALPFNPQTHQPVNESEATNLQPATFNLQPGAQRPTYRFHLNAEPGLFVTHRSEGYTPNGSEFAWQVRSIVRAALGDDFALSSDLRWYIVPDKVFPDTVRAEVEAGGGFSSQGIAPAYARFHTSWFDILIGQDNISWGPGRHGNLMVSANPLPMDSFQLQAAHGPVGFHSFTSLAEDGHGKKVASAHRLDIKLWDKGSLGIAETVLIAEEDFELRLLNPFTIYTIAEPATSGELEGKSKGSLGNLLASVDLELWLLPSTSLYGEVLIDDVQTRLGTDSWRNWGTKFGVLLGSHVADPFSLPNTDLRVEYVFVNQYAYTHWRPVSEYTHLGKLMGHPIGTDADSLWVELHTWLTDRVSGSVSYELQRHGEGDVTKAHSYEEDGDENWEFLSGVVETSHAISVEAKWHQIGQFLLSGRYTWSHVTNADNQPDVSVNRHEVEMTGLYRF